MRTLTHTRTLQLLLGLTLWVLLPVQCLLHCQRPSDHSNHIRHYVCAPETTTHPVQTNTLTPRPDRPAAVHQAVLRDLAEITLDWRHTPAVAFTPRATSFNHEPSVPPPRGTTRQVTRSIL